jgi:hypothetical protein
MPFVPVARRVFNKFTIDNGCWEWTASRFTGGYGMITENGKCRGAHRVMYELLVGPIPEGLGLDHLCRNRGCVNPGHLEPVSIGENVLRGEGITAQNAAKTHCMRGHEFTVENTYAASGKWRACRECHNAKMRRRNAAARNI